jgi:hypothetical protein
VRDNNIGKIEICPAERRDDFLSGTNRRRRRFQSVGPLRQGRFRHPILANETTLEKGFKHFGALFRLVNSGCGLLGHRHHALSRPRAPRGRNCPRGPRAFRPRPLRAWPSIHSTQTPSRLSKRHVSHHPAQTASAFHFLGVRSRPPLTSPPNPLYRPDLFSATATLAIVPPLPARRCP